MENSILTNMSIMTCLKDKNILLLGLLALMICSCSSVKTSVERSTFAENLWKINSEGNMVTFNESVFNDARKQAAEKSNSEGMDCFVVKNGYVSPREAETTRTMYGKSSDGSSFSYEVPSEVHYSLPMSMLLVSFHNRDECKDIEITKGPDKVFYNNETIKNAKSVENKYLALEILVYVVPTCAIVLLMMM